MYVEGNNNPVEWGVGVPGFGGGRQAALLPG
jgi:hypothetical protein